MGFYRHTTNEHVTKMTKTDNSSSAPTASAHLATHSVNFRLSAFLATVTDQSIQALPASISSVDDIFADAHEQLDCQEIAETEQQNPTQAWLDAQAWTFKVVDASLVFCCEWTIAASLSPSVRIVLLHHLPCYFPTMPRGRGPPLEVMPGCFG